jgi:hypothetical protein
MILAFMAYSLAFGTLAALAAWLLEKALASGGRPRRAAWIAGIAAVLVVPAMATLLQGPGAPTDSAFHYLVRVSADSATAAAGASSPAGTQSATPDWNHWAAWAWGIASGLMLTSYLLGAWRLSARLRSWPRQRIESREVAVTPDVGPVVFGWRNPAVLLPGWLLSAPEAVRRLALAHEREHLAARDPQVLASATLLATLFPWHLPMHWMLRRLRFALEVDCDARVLRQGVDAGDYGAALLYVSERQAFGRPPTALALIERTSQLEQRIRIMIASPRRFARLLAFGFVALAGTAVFAAAQIAAPARPDDAPIKPPPGGDHMLRLGQSFETHINQKYPGLFQAEQTETAVIIMLVNADMSIAKSVRQDSPLPINEIKVVESMFETIGIPRAEVPYAGAMAMQSPTHADRRVLVAFTETKPPGKFVSRLFTNTRALDRQIYEEHFAGSPNATGANLWVLLDRDGKVLRTGQDAVPTDELKAVLASRFGGIRTQEVTVTPVEDLQGNSLASLTSLWLEPGSPAPKD